MKKKKKMEKRRKIGSTSARERYWSRRYRLFSLFDLGVELDEESWYSVTPEVLAVHHAARMARCGGRVVVDACCGVGGNTIHLARVFDLVIAVDTDERKLKMGETNAAIYGVKKGRIRWVCADFLTMEFGERVDAVFVSPPWGGPSYIDQASLALADFPINVELFWKKAKSLTANVALFLPRNVDMQSVRALGEVADVESNYINDRCVAVTVYFGKLVNVQMNDNQ